MAARQRWATGAVLLLLLGTFWALSLDQLARFPPVGEDEPWLAATSYKLAARGVYGNDLFAGYYGRERHDYNHLPVYLVLQAVVFRTAGLGVVQMRFLPVAAGMLLLALTFAVGRQVGGSALGVVAVLLLQGLRLADLAPQAGIPLLDVARVSRYDVLVPVLGLAAFRLFNRVERRGEGRGYLLCGLLAGLAGLTHLYGAFWLPALGSVLLLRRGGWLVRTLVPYLLIAGFVLPWLPWLAFVATGPADYAGQMLYVAGRFNLLDPAFYLQNLLYEPDRWHVGLAAGDVRPGAWVALAGLPPAVALLVAAGRRERGGRPFALGVVLAVQALLFAALLSVKLYNYGIAVWPLAALALAWLGLRLWRRAGGWPWRAALLALLALVLAEGAWSLAERRAAALATTPYARFESRVAAHIPPGSLVLGLPHYWLGLHQFAYRSWLVPVLVADPRYYHEPLAFDQALERVAPDVLLVDRHMERYFQELAGPAHPDHSRWLELQAFLDRHGAVLAARIEDATYGPMLVYYLDGATARGVGP